MLTTLLRLKLNRILKKIATGLTVAITFCIIKWYFLQWSVAEQGKYHFAASARNSSAAASAGFRNYFLFGKG
jgi:hypothetical protein